MSSQQQKAKKALDELSYGVYLVTSFTSDPQKYYGCTVIWAMQVSFEPPLVAISLASSRATYGAIKESGVFALQVASKVHLETAQYFGSHTSAEVDKFKFTQHFERETGAPIINDVRAYVDCKVIKEMEAGDHTIFIGKIVASDIEKEQEKLLFNPQDFYGKG